MTRFKLTFVLICATSFCLCEIDIKKKAKLVNDFVEFYNRLPNEIYTCDEGFLQSAQQTDISNAYEIEATLKVSETHNPETIKYLKCTATVVDLDVGVAVMKHSCQDDQNPAVNPANIEEVVTYASLVTEAEFVRRPIQLDNEVQTDTAVTSGEQFIAIPREEPKVHCIGCSSHVNPQAQGVNELADIGVRQLNSLESNVQHTLASVVDVERQVQVVNGVRYILTLLIDYNSCAHQQTDPCLISKACKVTILEKSWMRLPDGSKYRAILSNNCTKEWLFGDDGVVPPSDNKESNNINPANPDGGSDIIKVVHNVDVQSQQQTEKTMTDKDIKNLEEQIIPSNQFNTEPTTAKPASTTPLIPEGSKEHAVKVEPGIQRSPNSLHASEPQKVVNLDDDKKKTIDELLNYFDLAGFDTNRNVDQSEIRMKRSFDNDLKAINIAQKFQKIKKNIENAKHIYTLAQSVVDYLNEMDLEVKHRVLKDVITAEMESENNNNFYYLQFRTIVPCKLRNCKVKDTVTKICNAVVDITEQNPQILNVFCHDENNKNHLGKMDSVPSDDPVLLKLVQESIKKIETESKTDKAMILNKIIDASTQRVSGTLTKISMLLDQTDCDKTVPLELRMNCSVVEEYGSQICDVTIHERHWLKERSITHSCTERPIDVRFSIKRKYSILKSANDPVVLDMIQESLRSLEMQSKRNNKQVMIRLNSISTQLVAGFLTHIDFVVGLTTCPINVDIDESVECKLLENEPLKTCTAKVWDRSWIEDGRKIDVSCKDLNNKDSGIKTKLRYIETLTNQDLKSINVYTKKHSVGSDTVQNPNDPKYTQLAKESLAKYLQDTGNSQPHKVVTVKKVTVQVVAGSLTKIDFDIKPEVRNSVDAISCHSEIWERPWLNSKEITVSCQIDNARARTKREFVGGEKEEDPNDSKYKQLAKESLAKYLQDTGNSQPHKVVTVKKVTVQVVAGSLTKIDFDIKPEVRNSVDAISCHSEIWERPWLNSKEITVSCQIDNARARTKREFVGGEKEEDPNDSKYKQLAKESLAKYLQDTGNSQPHKVVTVKKVTVQVVAGSLTKIDFDIKPEVRNSVDAISCHSEIWERPWLNSKEITVSCQIDNARARTKTQLVGGEKEEDPNDSKYKQLAKESLAKYLQDTGNSQPHKVVGVKNVTVQVVAGLLTNIYFDIIPEVQVLGDTINCHSRIWEKSWLNFKEINVSCHIDNANTRTKRDFLNNSLTEKRVKRNIITGGFVEQDPKKSKYKVLADMSLQKYLQDAAISQPHEVINVEKALTQVVSGLRTIITFKIAPVAATPGDFLNCVSDIWQKSWENIMKITVNCKLDNYIGNVTEDVGLRLKRNIIDEKRGGPRLEDPSKQEFKELAKDALRKYQQKKHKGTINLVLVEVEKVISQVVSGTIHYIDFTVAHKSCAYDVSLCGDEKPVLRCHSKTIQRSWLLQKDIEVSCKIDRKRNKREVNLKELEENSSLDQLAEIEILDLDERGKRQTGDDNDLDEDTRFYYADRAIDQLNDQIRSSNLYKLITVHTMQTSMHMDNTPMVRIYLEAAETYCMRGQQNLKLSDCEELDVSNHRLCLARVWPSPDDEMVIQQVSVVCDTDEKFESVTGISLASLMRASIKSLEQSAQQKHKLVHLGEPHLIPSLDSKTPTKLSFVVGTTNCSKHTDSVNRYNCYLDTTIPSKACTSFIWVTPNSRSIESVVARCAQTEVRSRRSVSLDPTNATVDDLEIQKMVKESLEKLEMFSAERYKQRVLRINGYNSKVTSGKVTTIDFDVAFTSCLKYEWVDDITTCGVLEHLPRRHCIAEVWERLWADKGRNIEVSCQDEVVPVEEHVEFQSAATAMALANRALKYIEAKYPHPRKQKVVRIYSMDKQVVAGVHYRMKMEVGFTNCSALSGDNYCVIDESGGVNKFCRVNVWLRPWTDHLPNFRVSCDYHEATMAEMYHQLQAEHLFRDFLATYNRDYVNNHEEVLKRFEIFKANIAKIHELNTHERGTATYGVTRFADLTYDEFTQKHLGLKPSLRNENQVPMRKAQVPSVEVPETFDWREHGAVTAVKDQGSCGSCWAFSVTGNIEGQWQLKTGKLVSLSEQELVDCDKMDDGCNGGLPDNAYRAIEQLGGLELESDYPYEGEDDRCSFNKSMASVQITSAVNITSNETDMAKWLIEKGPISIGINANAMQFYMGGVSHPWKLLCNPSNLDHGVLIVGYGIKDYPLFHKRLPYWIVKNSWGPSWGEQGYYRVFRGDGTCGVNQMASSAVV